MSSQVSIKRKTVNNRDIISFTKKYGGEEHEVMVPTNQAVQVLATFLDAVNQDLENGRQFVLMRRESVGMIDGEPVETQKEIKASVLRSIAETLYDDGTADKVTALLDGDGDD